MSWHAASVGEAYARIFGTCFGITLIGAMLGPMAMATIFDRTGSYDFGLMLLPAFPLAAIGLLWLAKLLSKDRHVGASGLQPAQ